MKKIIFSAAFIILSLQANTSLNAVNREMAAEHKLSVSAQQVSTYLVNRGYTVNSTPTQNGSDWYVSTSKNGLNYMTTVHTSGSQIIGHEDILL